GLMKLGRFLGGLAMAGLVALGPGPARRAWSRPFQKAASKTQGEGTRIVLKEAFIDKYRNRVTIETDFRVDEGGSRHTADKDGEVHIGGVAAEADLPTVAELTNPDQQDILTFHNLAGGDDAGQRTVKISGAWRIWTEHPGTGPQVQGASLPPRFDT